MSISGLTIGRLAEQSGVGVETLRFYERKGLLRKPPRTESNYRMYPADAAQRVRFIRRAQELGFSLKEILELLSMRARPRMKCADVLKRAEDKIVDIDERIRSLEAMKKALSKLVSQCSGRTPVTECPILDAMDKGAVASSQ